MEIDVADENDWNLAMNFAFNDRFQNDQLPIMLKTQLEMGSDIEYVYNDATFGLTPDNPIPVNGQLGQLAYLSLLRTPDGQGFLFHRLGSEAGVDAYEILSFDGKHRMVVYLDMYHPRRSRKAIDGLTLHDKPSAFTGVSTLVGDFPLSLLEALPPRTSPRALPFATPEQLGPIVACFLPPDLFDPRFILQPEDKSLRVPEVEEPEEWEEPTHSAATGKPLGQSEIRRLPGGMLDISDDDMIFDGTWEAVITQESIASAHETRGIIVPTSKDAVEILPGRFYGWYPSKALAKREGLDVGELYDPVAIVIEQAHGAYCDLIPDKAGDFIPRPSRVIVDSKGFATEYVIEHGDLDVAKDWVKFVADYWAPLRTYYLDTTWVEIPAAFSDSGELEVRVYFRWLSVMDKGAWKVKFEEAKSELECEAPYSLTQRGGLVRTVRITGEPCFRCDKDGFVWVTPDLAEKVNAWLDGQFEKLPPGLNASQREALLRGTHPWCWPDSMSD